MYNGIGVGQNELKNIGMSDNDKNFISFIPKNLWHWWCDCTVVPASLETQDAAWIIFWKTWSSFNSDAIKEKWGNNKRHFENVHLNCYNKISKMLYHIRKAQNLYTETCTCLYYTLEKKKTTYLPIHVLLDLLSSFFVQYQTAVKLSRSCTCQM